MKTCGFLGAFFLLLCLSCVDLRRAEAHDASAFNVDLDTLKQWFTPKERLGKRLFFDTDLSHPPGQACATCHDPKVAFTDPDKSIPTSKGVVRGLFGNRNTPTAMYMSFSPAFGFDREEGVFVGGQFVDGRAATLEEQAKQPFLNPVEMNNPSKESVVAKVRNKSYYVRQFDRVYGPDALKDPQVAFERIADAIAAFERTGAFSAFSSKYDAFLAGRAKLTAQELRGLALYENPSKGNCAACHPSRADESGPALFTDFTYDNLGVPRNPYNPVYTLPRKFNSDGKGFVDKGLGKVVGLASEDGKVKVTTLRNIAVTGPYMHNGYFRSLRAVVDFYNTRDVKPKCDDPFTSEEQALRKGCWPEAEVKETVNKSELGALGLSDQDVDDVVAFLHTLTDGWNLKGRR
jgi:cytochrome c peroxidase